MIKQHNQGLGPLTSINHTVVNGSGLGARDNGVGGKKGYGRRKGKKREMEGLNGREVREG